MAGGHDIVGNTHSFRPDFGLRSKNLEDAYSSNAVGLDCIVGVQFDCFYGSRRVYIVAKLSLNVPFYRNTFMPFLSRFSVV